jgi:hypothetical protein
MQEFAIYTMVNDYGQMKGLCHSAVIRPLQ